MHNNKLRSRCTKPLSRILAFCTCLSCSIAMSQTIDVIPLQNRPAEEIQTLLAPMLESDEALSGTGFNLIVKSSEPRQHILRQLVEQLDSPLHTLLISVMQNSVKTAEELNTEEQFSISSSTIRMRGMTADTRHLDQQRTLQQIKTLEGQAAHIETGEIRPVETVTMYDFGYGYPGVASTTQMQQASSGFAVIARLAGNQDVVLDISPWSERFANRAGLSTQSAQSTLRTQLGKWVEIGGISDNQQSDRQGFRGFNVTTRSNASHILIKVDLTD